jgi:hypothetical protein
MVLKNNDTPSDALPFVPYFKGFPPKAVGLDETFLPNKNPSEEIKFLAILWRSAGQTKESLCH